MQKAIDPRMPAILLDIRGLLMRSYHSGVDINPAYDPETGERVNTAAHGAAKFLERILIPIVERYAPINIVAVSDGGNSLRKMVYPGYKAKRPEIPKAQACQIDTLLEGANRILLYLGATVVKVEDREADDVIAAFCKAMPDQYKFVYTVDQDLIQLADDMTSVILYDDPREEMQDKVKLSTGPETIKIKPRHVALYKSLVGDSSDCYGGVSGFGPAKWIELAALVQEEGLDQLDKAVATNNPTLVGELYKTYPNSAALRLIYNNHSDWRMMYYLAQLHPESIWGSMGTRFIQPVFAKRVPSKDKLFTALAMLGVDDFMAKFEKFMPTNVLVEARNLDKVFEHMNRHLEDSPAVGFDYESYDTLRHAAFQEAVRRKSKDYVDVLSQAITGASFCYGDNLQHAAYMSVHHRNTDNVDKSYIAAVVNELLELKKPLIIHNAGFELTVTDQDLPEAKIERPHDTRVIASYYDENLADTGSDGLKALSWELLRYQQTTYSEVLDSAQIDVGDGTTRAARDMSEVTGEQAVDYGCDDSLVAAHLWVLMRWKLIIENQWQFFLQNHTAPAHLMSKSFQTGMNIDYEVLEKHAAADQIVIDTGMVKVRQMLEEHCQTPNPAAVDAFLESDAQAIRHDLAERWKKKAGDDAMCGHERLTALWEEKRLALIEKSVYVPRVEVPRLYEFKGTKAQLRDVSDALCFSEVIDNDSGKGLTSWLLRNSDGGETVLTEEMQKFCELLAASVGQPLKKREGQAFEDLKHFCIGVMQPRMASDWVGDELNFNSPNQVQELLYCKMGLPVRRRSKVQRDSNRYLRGFSGSPATNKSAWNAALAEDCPPGDWRRECLLTIREVKEAETRFELYYRPYPLWRHPKDGCIHPSVKDPGTVTRRPTCGEPNALQVSKGPTREFFIPHSQAELIGTLGKVILKGAAPEIFIPKLPKRLILAPDFSGQELRITGSEAKDPELIKAYIGGEVYVDKYGVTRRKVADVHSLTTISFLHKYLQRELGPHVVDYLPLQANGRVSYDWYTRVRGLEDPEQLQPLLAKPYEDPKKLLKAAQAARGKMAKPTNFLITYLGTPSTLAENTSMPEEFCQQIMAEVFAAYARLKPWQDESIEFARANGYVTTAYGTRKHVNEEILSSDRGLRSRQERRAVNQKVQGCAADILHVVETDIVERDFLNRYRSHFLVPVYDELVLDVPLNDDLPALITEMAQIMDITPPGHDIPMMAEFAFGPNWYRQHELGERPHEKQVEEGLSKLFLEAA